jgi:uncharacterized protein DUF5681
MSKAKKKKKHATANEVVTGGGASRADYEIGYGRPPKETQYKPGQRGNPNGRPPGSPNKKTLIERALNKKIPVRKGDKITKVPALQVIAETFTVKAAQGDRHAAHVVINLAVKSGVLGGARDNSASSSATDLAVTARDIRPSDRLVESIDDNLLSNEEKIELSQLAERIDGFGDVMALPDDDLARLKQIVDKGRGKSVVPDADDGMKEAA